MSGSNSSAPGGKAETMPDPVSFTVHNVAAPDLGEDARRTRMGRVKMMLVLLFCAAPVIASYLTYFVIRPEGRSNYGTLIQPTRSLPSVAASALDGTALDLSTLKGQWLLVVVGPSSCAEDCQKQLYTQRQLREMLGRERTRLDKIWLVTDSGPVAPELQQAIAAVAPPTVVRLPREAVAAWLQPESGHALEDHLYVVDPMGEWMMRMPAQPDPARVKRDLDRLLRASGFWDQAGR
jgi:hypothetical protein